ncbi:hypothetical protein [Sphingobacterium bovistauri]|uniref:Lipoprotein n=1 Tax=Sphingobacterium bovistauri TaxID=2781959 RepID=A0ABS7Z7M1_9SPHI|nr:hypothetical protein [Sphingobacterium bovistauri]MCA5005411.1 hypothetical protein [Sphingobacterium bovistauri]
MKSKLYLGLFGMILFCYSSCRRDPEDNNLSKMETSIFDKLDTLKHMSKMEKYTKEMEIRMNHLRSLRPVSNEKLKSILPVSVASFRRNDFLVADMSTVGAASAKASYEDEGANKVVLINILDGAGEVGVNMLALLFLAFQIDKVEDFDFEKGIIKENKSNNNIDTEIQWLHLNRFLVTLKGQGCTHEELREILKTLDFSNLK